ncbi:MAG TPA: hypothetical protein VGI28_02450, partial [Stellaceae bacterium]
NISKSWKVEMVLRDIGNLLASRYNLAIPREGFKYIIPEKIVFDLQLADLPVQNVDLRLTGRSLRGRAAALEDARRAVQKLLLPGVDLVRVNPIGARQLGNVRSPLNAASATFALNAAPCFLRVCFMSCSRAVARPRGRAPP